ncbi:type I glyceraldehyde-3-phosphate dehydrogenase [Bacteroidota bacterium]
MTRVAINGFGRIGRITMRALLKKKNIEVVAINDLTDTKTLTHLFKYDSVHRQFDGDVEQSEAGIRFNGVDVKVFAERDPSKLPWKELGVDIVVESTGFFRSRDTAGLHLKAGAKQVIISAPAKDADIPSVVLGVNDHEVDIHADIISNASCTTNCAAPMVRVLNESVGIESLFLSTIHAYTSDQVLHDTPHADLRRGRAAANSIIPSSTGAAVALGRIFPHLKGKLAGAGIRVPVLSGSLTEMTCVVKSDIDVDALNKIFKESAEGQLKGVLEYTDEPLVSCDIIGNSHSCIFDSDLTTIIGKTVKVVGWYDNEAGYSNRMADLIEKLGK